MSRTTAVLLTGALAIAGTTVAASGAAAHGGRPLSTTLTGAAEVTPGDPDGEGTASLRVNVGQGQVCYELSVEGIAAATAAHIHEAPAGSAGPVVVGLEAPADGSSEGCVTVSRELAKDILTSPSDYYVNVHNAEFPAGALRGQLSR